MVPIYSVLAKGEKGSLYFILKGVLLCGEMQANIL